MVCDRQMTLKESKNSGFTGSSNANDAKDEERKKNDAHPVVKFI
jgi:hypothetical protein